MQRPAPLDSPPAGRSPVWLLALALCTLPAAACGGDGAGAPSADSAESSGADTHDTTSTGHTDQSGEDVTGDGSDALTDSEEGDDTSGTIPDDSGSAADTEDETDGGADSDPGDDADSGADTDSGGDSDTEDSSDEGPPTTAPACERPTEFDYSCRSDDPESCPAGFCVLRQCIAPEVQEGRWAGCGNGVCDPCWEQEDCPVDCADPPWTAAPRDLGARDTLTVYVHGFRNAGDQSGSVYGEVRRPGSLGRTLMPFVEDVADGVEEPEAARQIVVVGYYGATPADWVTAEDAAEIEAYDVNTTEALHRYALIVARFITRRLEVSGSEAVQVACHSMGCHVLRYMLENDLDGHASSGRVTRWFTSGGVVAGARLSRLYDNPTVREVGGVIGINTADFIHMNPDHVREASAVWDRQLYEANNPRLTGMLIHHMGATDPRLSDALNVRLLDLNNPEDEPNDGIVHTFDQFFHGQNPAVSARTVEGEPRAPTRTFLYREHFDISDDDATGLVAAAALYHGRKVRVTVTEVTVHNDLERSGPFDITNGDPPAELIFHVRVRYDPYVQDQFGQELVVHRSTEDHRTAEMFQVEEGQTITPGYRLFEGPVLDEMEEFWMEIDALETNCYPRFDVNEWCISGSPSRFLRHRGQFALEDHEQTFENDNIRFTVRVEVDRFVGEE